MLPVASSVPFLLALSTSTFLLPYAIESVSAVAAKKKKKQLLSGPLFKA